MKRSFTAILCIAFFLCGCKKRADQEALSAADYTSASATTSVSSAVTENVSVEKPESTSATETGDREYHELDEYTIEFIEPEADLKYSDMDSMTEAKLLEIAQSDANWYISDLAGKELLDGTFRGSINVIPSDKEGWQHTVDRLSTPNGVDEYKDHVFEVAAETDEYAAVRSSYTELRRYQRNATTVESHIEREYFDIILKELCRTDGYMRYSGEMSADAVQRCVDLLNLMDSTDTPLCREVQETDSAFIYGIYHASISHGDWGLSDRARLCHDVYTVDKLTGDVTLGQYDVLDAEIPNTATDMPLLELE